MRMFLIPLAAAAIGAAAVAAAPDAARRQADRDAVDAADFAKATKGLVPGRAMTCLDTRFRPASLSAIGSRLIYRVSSRLVYVNETNGGCESVRRGDTLVTRQFAGRLCRGDIAQTVDLPSGSWTGGCAIGDFIPYTPG